MINEYFNDFPVDFFRITPEDFLKIRGSENPLEANQYLLREQERIKLSIIEPDNEGRIFTNLQTVLNLDERDTTVINASVGQGKTYSILKAVESYYNNYEDAYIFIAVPFVSLIEQYLIELIDLGIPEESIYRYEWLDPSHEYSNLDAQISRRIHIVTANCLLGNAGDNAPINSYIKRKYLQEFSEYLKGSQYRYEGSPISESDINILYQRGRMDLSKIEISNTPKKAVFIYDEIHDSINNFKKNNIFNLWHWSEVIHKNIIISATYNDASIPVIEYLSRLTEDKIHIIESRRKIIRKKQSELFLHYNANNKYKHNDTIITEVVTDCLSRGKNIDILCFSKKLSEDLVKLPGGLKEVLEDYLEPEDIKLCVSDLIYNQRAVRGVFSKNRYDKNKINIGSTFKTGVNIEKDNHALIIIFPSESTKMPFENLYGIFSGGVNDVIQALARQRRKGEIHLILPLPEKMDYNTLQGMDDEQKEYFISAYNSVTQPAVEDQNLTTENRHNFSDILVKYKPLSSQKEIVSDLFKEYINSIMLPIIKLSNNILNENFLETPDLMSFRIQKGSKGINRDKFLAGDLSAFITYCAFTNQFINCRLKRYNVAIVILDPDRLEGNILEQYEDVLAELDSRNNHQLHLVFEKFRDYLFDGKKVYLGNIKIEKSNYKVKKAILNILMNIETPEYLDSAYPYREVLGENFNHLNYLMLIMQEAYQDARLGRRTYHAQIETDLYTLREKMIETLFPHGGSQYLKPFAHNNIFTATEIDASDLISQIASRFPLILENATFKNLLSSSNEEKEEKLYKMLSETIGSYEKSRKYSFLDYRVRKLATPVLDVPYS